MKKKKTKRTKENIELEKIRWERFVSRNGEEITINKRNKRDDDSL